MADGEVLNEILELLKADKIPTQSATRLLLTSQMVALETLQEIKDSFVTQEKLAAVVKEQKELKENPLVRAGFFLQKHARVGWTTIAAFLAILIIPHALQIANWIKPLINEDERLILNSLREIRNDLAHVPYLTYDINLKKEVVRKMIDNVEPIHNKLVEEIIKNQKK